MIVQNMFSINDFWRCSVTQRKECEKDHKKEKKEYLHAAEYPTRFSTKRVNPIGPAVDKDQRNEEREDA